MNAQITWDFLYAGVDYVVTLKVNGGVVLELPQQLEAGGAQDGQIGCNLSDIIQLSAGDVVELYVSHNSVGAESLIGGSAYTFLSIYKLP